MSTTIPTSTAKQQLIAFLQAQREAAVLRLAINPDNSKAQGTAYNATRWIKWIAVKATRADVIGYYYELKQNHPEMIAAPIDNGSNTAYVKLLSRISAEYSQAQQLSLF